MTPIENINFDDYTESIPAFLTIIMMPLTYSIAEGIVVWYAFVCTLLKVLTGKQKDLTFVVMVVLAVLFI
jgi:adenine/guanine/hypoxanthine permease